MWTQDGFFSLRSTKQFAELFLRFGGRRCRPLAPSENIFAPGFVFKQRNAGHEDPFPPPEAANWMLAIVQNLFICIGVSLNLNQFYCPALLCVSYGNTVANTVAMSSGQF